MENMICPSCKKDFGIKGGMSGTDVKGCISCGDFYTVMYVAGFTDGFKSENGVGVVRDQDTVNKLIELEALVSEREGMLVANKERENQGYAFAYDEKMFTELARDIRALNAKETE